MTSFLPNPDLIVFKLCSFPPPRTRRLFSLTRTRNSSALPLVALSSLSATAAKPTRWREKPDLAESDSISLLNERIRRDLGKRETARPAMDSEEAEKYIQMVKEQQERGLQKLKGIRQSTEAGPGGFSYKVDPYSLLSGDYVVHKKVGIGRFVGIKFDVPKDSSEPLEYVFIEYADGMAKLPLKQASRLLYRYNLPNETKRPRTLSRLSDTSVWERRKTKGKVAIQKMVVDLMELYLHRLRQKRFPYPKNPFMSDFAAQFPYDATPDQKQAFLDVEKDLTERETPMDRLICGDVGFGKTEVALRAIFCVVFAGKQAMVLAPTIVLAKQHYDVISERFSLYPHIKVGLLSRFQTKAEKEEYLEMIKSGHLNIIVGELLLLAFVILIGLFALQHCGTHKVAFMFAPIVIMWLISILFIGLYNIIHWNPKIIHAISPLYIIKFFRVTGQDGWISLGGVLLSVTGTEAMFADLGHFTSVSIRLAFAVVVYPCLVAQYMGQAAFLSKNLGSIPNSFYNSIPDPVFWPVFVIATLAAIVGSQAVITATFSIIKQCHALGCFPRVKVVHTLKYIYGQIYIPEINWILMILTLAIAIGFQDTTLIGNAYGLACMIVMFITTFLLALVIVMVWQKSCFLAGLFLGTLWIVEGVYLSAALMKVPQGGWVSLVLAFIFMITMYVWHYGTRRKYSFDLHNKVSLKWLLGLGPSLGIVRVPGIGLVYSELATGVPAIFSQFVTNLPAFHKVVVFVCVKSVPVPHVYPEERFLIGRVCPKPYRMYRCIVRYGYKDIQREDGDFENQLIQSIAEFIQMEAGELQSSASESQSYDGRMAVSSSQKSLSNSILRVSEVEEFDFADPTRQSSKSMTLQSLRSVYEDEYPQGQVRRRAVRFQLTVPSRGMESSVREDLMDVIGAKEAGVAYVMGHSYVKARKSSSWLKKLTIDIGYSFLRKNCRGPAVALNIPHISLIEVGMIYYV